MIIKLMVLQVAILRPILVFMTAVLWTDGKYVIGGQVRYLYQFVCNIHVRRFFFRVR